MKVYSYVVHKDRGFSPNPFWRYCTLACDQGLIRQVAEIGDWIVGLTPIDKKEEDHQIIYVMKIIEKITHKEYWDDPRFALKKPDFTKAEEIFKCGDNIYEPTNNEFKQIKSYHSKSFFDDDDEWKIHKREDLQGKFILIADKDNFFYFGSQPIGIPSKELANELFCDVGHRCIADPTIPASFHQMVNDLQTNGKKGINASPTIWPKEDNSWNKTI
ncbi:MAG: hypothetical protein GF308_06415 [Candidatus Heimdallarchaeota archaeon]|nr:hypothetical protein [Candidatus Heimdallarchaeota archaeon]